MNTNKAVAAIALAVIACASAFSVEAAAPAVDKLVACADVSDSLQRLACFDREVVPFARLKPSPMTTPSPVPAPPSVARSAVPASTPPTSPPTPKPTLGEEQLSPKLRPAEREAEEVVHATVTSQREISPDLFVITLDNGQTWRHQDARQGSFLHPGDAVTIQKAALGSYRLSRDAGNSKNWIRVTRIR